MAYPPKRTNNFSRPNNGGGRTFGPRPAQGGATPGNNSNNSSTPSQNNFGNNSSSTPRPGAGGGAGRPGGNNRPFVPRPPMGGGPRPSTGGGPRPPMGGGARRPFVPRPPRPFNPGGFRGGRNQDRTKINNYITAREVMLIDETGKNVGVVSRDAALEKARAVELDLVEITATATPPVCKILDYGKYKYQEEKKKKEAKKKQKTIHVKEIQIRPGIDQHDLMVKMKKMQGFLEDGDKVRVAIRMFGRATNQRELAMAIFQKVLDFLGDIAKVEKTAEMDLEKRRLMMMITRNPLKKMPDKNDKEKSGNAGNTDGGDQHNEKNNGAATPDPAS